MCVSIIWDVYQFVAQDIAPPFVLCVTHPYQYLLLREVANEPALPYSNDCLIVDSVSSSHNWA